MPSAVGWSASSPAPRVSPQDDPLAMRHAGRELLSLALIDARNQLLQALAHEESATALRVAARAGWYQEHWIGSHPQRQRGEACDPRGPRLAGIEPRIAAWLDDDAEPPAPQALRGYLAETLEITLDLLAAADEDEAGLYFYRLSLLHEDALCEALAEGLLMGSAPARAERAPIGLAGRRWLLGSAPGGLVPGAERWAHEVEVPEFEIDAQAVNWARFVEFADDGGYDRRELWSAPGWAWVQAQGRRAPHRVEQLRDGVIVQRRGGLQRAPGAQAVTHASRFEAEAWCRWAGRRLPTEPEWELAASTAAGLGFVWGDVFEWVVGSARAWPGEHAVGALGCGAAAACGEGQAWPAVLRGASFATPARGAHPKARRFAPPGQDTMFCGFRSCAT